MQNYAAGSFRQRKVKKRKKRFLAILLVIIFSVGLYTILFKGHTGQTKGVTSATLFESSNQKPAPTTQSESLKQAVTKALAGTSGTYSIGIKNLKTGESYFQNEHQKYLAGSLYKLWTLATVTDKLQTGELTENQVLTQDIATLNDKFHIDPELAEQTDGTISLSVWDALTQMIVISHNYSALLLTEKVKLSTVANFLKANQFTESMVGTKGEAPTTTVADIVSYLEKLYRGNLADKEYTQKMLGLLKDQQLNNKLPKYLPKDVVVAHKTGEIDMFSHDAGIVYNSKSGDYIIVVLSETEIPAAAEDRIAEVSKEVYNYFQSK